MTLFFHTHLYLIGIVAFLLGLFGMPAIIAFARQFNLTVKPNKRTSHVGEVPNVGGLNICMTFLLCFITFVVPFTRQVQFIALGAMLMTIIGFIDDVFELQPLHKTIGELAVATILIVFARLRITHLGGIFGLEEIGIFWGSVLSFVVFFAIVNAVNLIDGVDGLASGLGIVFFLFFAVYFYLTWQLIYAILSIIMIGSLFIFFFYNVFGRSKRKIFMGDSGSLLLGYLLTANVFHFCELNCQHLVNESYIFAAPHATCICLLSIPIFDAIRVSLVRVIHHKNPFLPDKNHIHHLFLTLGCTHVQTTLIILAMCMIFILFAVWAQKWGFWAVFSVDLLLYLLFVGVTKWLIKKRSKTP